MGIPGVTYFATASDWRARGYPVLPGATDRDSLVLGTYIPNADTTAPRPGTTYTQLDPPVGSNSLSFRDPGIVLDGYEIWGEVRNFVDGTILRNCKLHGMNPDLINGMTGLVKAYDATARHLTIEDSLLSPKAWVDERGSASLSPYSAGIHGHDVTLRRSEIRDVQDGWNIVGHNRPYDSVMELLGSWVHGGYFQNNWYGPSDGRTHSDPVQFNTGKNITIAGNMIGGVRDMVGYRQWPGGSNTGDDFWNSAFMIKQELNDTVEARIENVLIEKNFIAGGSAAINHVFNPSFPASTFATTVIRDNKFFQRGSGGRTSANGPGTYDTGDGWYIIRSISFAGCYSGNVIYETGASVPINNG